MHTILINLLLYIIHSDNIISKNGRNLFQAPLTSLWEVKVCNQQTDEREPDKHVVVVFADGAAGAGSGFGDANVDDETDCGGETVDTAAEDFNGVDV